MGKKIDQTNNIDSGQIIEGTELRGPLLISEHQGASLHGWFLGALYAMVGAVILAMLWTAFSQSDIVKQGVFNLESQCSSMRD